jgi:phage terminase large subunit GpA-like protein
MYSLLDGIFSALKPTPIMTVTEWSDKNRYLSSVSAAEPGRWKTSRTPYQEEIGDNMGPNSPIIDSIAVKGVQLGFTENALNVAGMYMDVAPCPIMYVMPTIEMGKSLSKIRLTPMIDNCPNLKNKVRTSKKAGGKKDSGDTILEKHVPGGMLSIVGANSPAGLSSKPVKIVLADEIDRYPMSAGDEGSPVDLVRKRSSTFGRKRKFYGLSTPTTDKLSVIQKLYENTDQRKYFVHCPECRHPQHFEFENLKWTPGKFDTVQYFCNGCGVGIDERYKTQMMSKEDGAKWIPTCPEKIHPTKRGYHINSLYSPIGWLSWADIAEQWEDAQGDIFKLRVFINTILGQTWKEDGESPPWENLYNRREKYAKNSINKKVVFLTCGVDVQKDRLELEIVGWCADRQTYSIDYRIIHGATDQIDVWNKLANVVGESWTRDDGLVLPMRLMAVDCNYNTQHAHAFCARFDVTRVVPVVGRDSQQVIVAAPKAVQMTAAGKKIGKVKVYNLGVSLLKSELYGNLKIEINEDGTFPPGYCHFPEYDSTYFRGITAEQLQFKTDKRGFRSYQWVKKYERNEPLDVRIYARAAAALLGMDRFNAADWENMEKSNEPRKPVKTVRKKSDYWDR